MLDISEYKEATDTLNEGLPFEPVHPVSGEKLGTVWQVASYESNRYKMQERKARTQGLQDLRKNKVDAAKMDKKEIALLASLVVSWDDNMKDNGKVLPYSSDNVARVLSMPIIGPSLCSQLDEFANDNEAFFKASKISSPTPSSGTQNTASEERTENPSWSGTPALE